MTPAYQRNSLRLRDGTLEGAEMQQFGWVKHVSRAKTGYLSRIGLVRTLVWPFIFKNYSVRDFAEFLKFTAYRCAWVNTQRAQPIKRNKPYCVR